MFSLKCRALITNNSTLRFNKVILTKNINCFLSRNLRRSIFGFKRHAFFSLFFVEAQTVALKVVGVNRENTICFLFWKAQTVHFFLEFTGGSPLTESYMWAKPKVSVFKNGQFRDSFFFEKNIWFFWKKQKHFFALKR